MPPKRTQTDRALSAMARGETMKQVAFDLGITYGTLKYYMANKRKKLGGVSSVRMFALHIADRLGVSADQLNEVLQ